MKYLFSYGLWVAAILGYVLIFTEPNHIYRPYADNAIVIYEILCWVVFCIAGLATLILSIAKVNSSDLEKKGSVDGFKKAAENIKMNKPYQILLKYIHYAFIIFVGFFVGDMSMAFVLTMNAMLMLMLKNIMQKIIEEAAYGN